jgi:hypothetical protein
VEKEFFEFGIGDFVEIKTPQLLTTGFLSLTFHAFPYSRSFILKTTSLAFNLNDPKDISKEETDNPRANTTKSMERVIEASIISL